MTLDNQYKDLLKDIIDNGVEKQNSTGQVTISVFGRQIRHNMRQGFPLITTKKMEWEIIVTELLWFLRGDSNIKFLLDYNCHIWDNVAYLNYQKHMKNLFENESPMMKEEFINKIKADFEFGEKWGNLGPIYGKQWRQWQGMMDMRSNKNGSLSYDQIHQLVHSIKTNPDSNRLMVNAWNVAELDQMAIPPCHYGFQVYTHEEHGQRYISLMWNQRSCNLFLGIPFNIATYGLLLEIIAKEVKMIPYELIGNLGDVHLNKNHIEQSKEQIGRAPYDLPTVTITERNWYQHEKVKEHMGPKSFNDIILSYRPDCFRLNDYQSHPKIKAIN